MPDILKRLAAHLPLSTQQDLKRWHYARHIRRGTFRSHEPEFALLGTLVRPGDWVLDIGANVGHYTLKLAELVGPFGRVIAFEPVAESFEALASNVVAGGHRNVTLIQAAASDAPRIVRMAVPRFATGLMNYYQATVSDTGTPVIASPADPFTTGAIRLAKIDAEGHELAVLAGLVHTITVHRPVLIVEQNDPGVCPWLERRGYRGEWLPGSPNLLWRAVEG